MMLRLPGFGRESIPAAPEHATGEMEWMQNWRFKMELLPGGFSSKDLLKNFLPSSLF